MLKKILNRITRKGFLLTLKSFGIAFSCLILLAFFGTQIQSNVTAITKARNEVAAFTAKFEQIDKLKKDYEIVKVLLPKMESIIPTVDAISGIVDYINSLGAQTNNTVAVQFDSTVHAQEGALNEIVFSLEVNGTLPSIENLLTKIEHAPYLINIRSVSLNIVDFPSNQFTAHMSGIVYLQNDQIE